MPATDADRRAALERPASRKAEDRHRLQVRVIGKPATPGRVVWTAEEARLCSSKTPHLLDHQASGVIGSRVASQTPGATSAPAMVTAAATAVSAPALNAVSAGAVVASRDRAHSATEGARPPDGIPARGPDAPPAIPAPGRSNMATPAA